MKKLSLLAAILVIASSFGAVAARAQDEANESRSERERRERAAHSEMTRQELVNLEKEAVRAIQTGSTAFFNRVYSDDFLASTSSGQILDKAGYIRAIQQSQAKYGVFVATDINVRTYVDTAVVTCMWTAHGMVEGRSVDRQWRVTHVYINGEQGWRAILSHETLLPH
jgi:hypothetical protein